MTDPRRYTRAVSLLAVTLIVIVAGLSVALVAANGWLQAHAQLVLFAVAAAVAVNVVRIWQACWVSVRDLPPHVIADRGRRPATGELVSRGDR